MFEERRSDPEQREWIERLLNAAGERGGEVGARKVLSEYAPHDLDTFEGKEAFKADLRHMHRQRSGCEKMKSAAGPTVIKTALGAATLGILYAGWDYIKAIGLLMKGSGQ